MPGRRGKLLFSALWLWAIAWCIAWAAVPVDVYADEKCSEPHQIENIVVNEATCDTNGTINEVCSECGAIGTVFKTEKLPHSLSEYTITIPAGNNTDGEQEAICSVCGYIDVKPYICPHIKLFERTAKEPNCEEDGLLEYVCGECTTVLKDVTLPALGHDFGDWVTTKGATCQQKGLQEKTCSRCAKIESRELQIVGHSYGDWWISKSAAPGQSGTKQRDCIWCSKSETKSYEFTMGANAIYAPGTSLNHSFVVCEMTQANVDRYNIVYAHSFNGVGPFILGHNTGSMRYISQIKVGQMIYVSLGGNIQKYKVVVSEYGLQNDSWTDIIGQSTGTSIFDSFGGTTLHMYTCYGGVNGRWIVLATKC